MKLWQQRITKNGFSSFFILLFYVFFSYSWKTMGHTKNEDSLFIKKISIFLYQCLLMINENSSFFMLATTMTQYILCMNKEFFHFPHCLFWMGGEKENETIGKIVFFYLRIQITNIKELFFWFRFSRCFSAKENLMKILIISTWLNRNFYCYYSWVFLRVGGMKTEFCRAAWF